MAEVVQGTEQEFWQPPSPGAAAEAVVLQGIPSMAEACPRCHTEFLMGSRFCHTCGARRPRSVSTATQEDAAVMANLWEQAVGGVRVALTAWRKIEFPFWLRYLHFHEIKNWVGLPTASLIAFVIGLGCVAGALLVGLLTAKTFVDWQAIQFYRVEWLLAATVAFVAGILLKKDSRENND